MLMTQCQLLNTHKLRCPNPERISKVSISDPEADDFLAGGDEDDMRMTSVMMVIYLTFDLQLDGSNWRESYINMKVSSFSSTCSWQLRSIYVIALFNFLSSPRKFRLNRPLKFYFKVLYYSYGQSKGMFHDNRCFCIYMLMLFHEQYIILTQFFIFLSSFTLLK